MESSEPRWKPLAHNQRPHRVLALDCPVTEIVNSKFHENKTLSTLEKDIIGIVTGMTYLVALVRSGARAEQISRPPQALCVPSHLGQKYQARESVPTQKPIGGDLARIFSVTTALLLIVATILG